MSHDIARMGLKFNVTSTGRSQFMSYTSIYSDVKLTLIDGHITAACNPAR